MVDTRVVRESSRTERFPCSEWSRDALVATERNVGSMSGLTEPMCGLSNGDDAVTLSTTVVEDSRRCGQLSRRATSVVSRLVLARVPSRDPRREAVGSVIGAKYATPLRATTSNCFFLGASAPAREMPLSRFRSCTKAPVPLLVRGRLCPQPIPALPRDRTGRYKFVCNCLRNPTNLSKESKESNFNGG